MNKLKLDLGRFNQCVEYLDIGRKNPDYSVDEGDKMLYHTSYDSINCGRDCEIISPRFGGDCFSVPVFDIGIAVDNGRINDDEILQQLLCHIEFRVFNMINKIINESMLHTDNLKLEDIKIPIRAINVFDDDKNTGCYGWAELGIAIVVKRKKSCINEQ